MKDQRTNCATCGGSGHLSRREVCLNCNPKGMKEEVGSLTLLHRPLREWKCSKCGHVYKETVSRRIEGAGCPRCEEDE